MLPLAAVSVLAGLALAGVGLLGLRERLPRNRFAGVRTAATMRDERAFRLANKIAGLPTIVAGVVGVLAGVAGYLAGSVLVLAVGIAGLIAITVGAGVLGHRAAAALPEPKPEPPAGCGGCGCGNCDLTSRFARS